MKTKPQFTNTKSSNADRFQNFAYGLILNAEGNTYTIVNRHYDSIGSIDAVFITDSIKSKLSWCDPAKSKPGSIFLYNDGCIPNLSASNSKAYEARLEVLDNAIKNTLLKITHTQYLLNINDELPENRRHKFTFSGWSDIVSCDRCNIRFDYYVNHNNRIPLDPCLTDDEILIKSLLE